MSSSLLPLNLIPSSQIQAYVNMYDSHISDGMLLLGKLAGSSQGTMEENSVALQEWCMAATEGMTQIIKNVGDFFLLHNLT